MKDSDLEKALKLVSPPERSEEYWETFPQLVSAELRTLARRSRPEIRRPFRLAWGLGFAMACLVIGFAVGNWHIRHRESDPLAMLQNQKMLREVLTMFPNRLRAIEQDERGLRLVLSDNADVPKSTPLWVKICDGDNCREFVTFSGQELQFAKEKVEVLVDAQGQVMLVGNQFVWSGTKLSGPAKRLRIQARPLDYVM